MAEEDSFSEVPDEISVFENVLVEEDSFDLPESLLELGENLEVEEVGSNEDALKECENLNDDDFSREEEPEELLYNAREIYNCILRSASFSKRDVHFVVGLYTMQTSNQNQFHETLSDEAVTGFMNALFEKKASPKGVTAIFKFFSIVAVEVYNQGCKQPLSDLNECLDVLLDAADPDHRFMGCQLTAVLLNHASISQSAAGSQGEALPPEYIQELCLRLSNRHRDKSTLVRSLALEAFARIPIDDFMNNSGELTSPSRVIAQSLYDICVDVRKAAIKLLPLSSSEILDDAITYLANEQDSRLRQLMVERLATNVHIRSYTLQQRMRLISNIYFDPHITVKNMLGTVIVPRWLRWLTQEEWDSRMDVDEPWSVPGGKLAYPMALIEFLDYLDYEDVSIAVMKQAFIFYMESTCGSIDPKQFLLFMRKYPKELRETSGILHKHNLSHDDNIDLPQRLFVHRCLVDVICRLYDGNEHHGDRDHCINKLLPNFLVLATLFKNYSHNIFHGCEIPSTIQIFTLRQICHFISFVDLDCALGKTMYVEALKTNLLDPSYSTSLDMITFCMNTIQSFISSEEDQFEFLQWIGEAACDLLESVNFNISEDMDPRIRDDSTYYVLLRVATVVHNALSNADLEQTPTVLLNICTRIMPSLAVSSTVDGRQLCCRILGVIGLRDTGTFINNNMVKLRVSIELDKPAVKQVAFLALGDLIIKRRFSYVADRCFPDISGTDVRVANLKKFVEDVVAQADKSVLEQILTTACRLSLFFAWNELIGSMFFRLFHSSSNNEGIDLIEFFFSHYVDQQGSRAKISIVNGFMHGIQLADDVSSFRFGILMNFVCKNIARQLKEGTSDLLPNELTIETVLLLSILQHIEENPNSKSSEIPTKYIKEVYDKAENIARILERDLSAKKKMVTTIGQYLSKLRKKFKLESSLVGQPIRKRSAIDIMQEAVDHGLVIPKAKRSCTELSKSDELIKSEIPIVRKLSQIQASSSSTSNEELIVIEEDSGDEKELMPPPSASQPARSRKNSHYRRYSQPVIF